MLLCRPLLAPTAGRAGRVPRSGRARAERRDRGAETAEREGCQNHTKIGILSAPTKVFHGLAEPTHPQEEGGRVGGGLYNKRRSLMIFSDSQAMVLHPHP